jgi:hypothetical protein
VISFEIIKWMFLIKRKSGEIAMKKFNALSIAGLLGAVLLSTSAHAVSPTNVTGLVGTWVNTNSATGGIVKVVVTNTASGLTFQSFGACSPTPCVHTVVSAQPFSASVSSNTAVGLTAYRNSGFKYSRYSAERSGVYLRLDSFDTFAAGDTRKNYTKTEYFAKP